VNFCHFGQALNAWLLKQNAQPWFDLVCVDQSSAADLNIWTHHLEQVTGLQLDMAHEDKRWTDPEDSVSMIYEALTAGCKVGVIEIECLKSDRITQLLDRLLTHVLLGENKVKLLNLQLDEAARVAHILLST
ncbi:ELM1/GtrOC1 family putative glycosyltransferase, partial [Acinetobacter pragensis]|uniref:ELM1/GtrOC1 family putative glycosyltransferase n=1 Tax=Acinetobacter pragensis TaxID=1806892 RepID=UPI000AD5934B